MLYYKGTESNDALERLVHTAAPKASFLWSVLFVQEEEYQSALPVKRKGIHL